MSSTQKVLQPQLKSWKVYSSAPSLSHQVPKSQLLIHRRKLGLLTCDLGAGDASVFGGGGGGGTDTGTGDDTDDKTIKILKARGKHHLPLKALLAPKPQALLGR